MLMNQVRQFNESVILDYADVAKDFLLTTIDNIEESPMLEKIISQIENYFPTEEEADKFISNLLENLDLSQLINMLGHAEDGIDMIDKLTEMVSKIPNMTDYVAKLTALRPNIEETLENHTSSLDQQVNNYLDGADSLINNTSEELNKTLNSLDTLTGDIESKINNASIHILNDTATKVLETSLSNNTAETRYRREINITEPLSLQNLSSSQAEGNDNLARTADDLQLKHKLDTGKNISETIWVKLDLPVGNTSERIHSEISHIKDTGEKAMEDLKERAGHVAKDVAEHLDSAREIVENATEKFSDLGERTHELAMDLKEGAEKEARKLIKQARSIADEAQKAAKTAAEEAEIAMKRAEQLAKEAAEEIDANAKALALGLAEKAKEAAETAKKAAVDALNKAQAALNEADDIIKAAAMGAFSWAKVEMGKLRYYAKKAFSGARSAVIEAKKGARIVVRYVGVAKREVIKAYEYAKQLYKKLRIRRLGRDTFCSDFKVMFCVEVCGEDLFC